MPTDNPTATHILGTQRQFTYKDLSPNPLNPRRVFDREPLDVLKESIRNNGILVPLTVYQEPRSKSFFIIDGERRWRCAEEIATDERNPRQIPVPANVVDPPTPMANILWMFNIHNLREQWELMPTALSLQVLMKELGETDDQKLSKLTKLSEPHVRRCKVLLTFPKKYQRMMLDPDPRKRVKANFFIELKPVLDLYETLPKRAAGNKSRDELTDHFLAKYLDGKISSVINFRRVLEAYDRLRDTDRSDEFVAAAQGFAANSSASIRKLFDPLVADDRTVESAEETCRTFLKTIKRLKVGHATRKRSELRKLLNQVVKEASDLISQLEG